MQSRDFDITSLKALSRFRSAPELNSKEEESLEQELAGYISGADWFTIGIMAPSLRLAISSLREMERCFCWPQMKTVTSAREENRPVFLKANQKTGEIHIRNEDDLGVGILLSCQHDLTFEGADTFGPFPLDFFSRNNENLQEKKI